jgi:hypothetical protein
MIDSLLILEVIGFVTLVRIGYLLWIEMKKRLVAGSHVSPPKNGIGWVNGEQWNREWFKWNG